MINADEHKKLLAQIAQLEKNSINYFDVEKEFFLIDSDNLFQIRPRLYGYSIQRSGIYEEDNLTTEAIAGLDGRGCYVYVDVKDGKITIKQDLNGSWGIYLFRHGDYFALSNSFFRLLDHIKFKYPLTVNRDYCHQLIVNDLCSHSYSDTAVKEISLVERNAILHIDIAEKTLEVELIDYRENTIALDSAEGIAILDGWIDFWGSVLRNVAQHTKFIQASLSGGFDTRTALIHLLHSGIPSDKLRIYSYPDNLYIHKEDRDIASQIAAHYGLKLNQDFPKREFLNSSLADIWNMELYGRQTFHKFSNISFTQKGVDKCYSVEGYGGEVLRGYALKYGSWESYTKRRIGKVRAYSRNLSEELSDSMRVALNAAFNAICNKYNIKDKNSGYIQQYLYQDVRCRNHFGKLSVIRYFKGDICLQPAFDPQIQTLKITTPECPDYKLLQALIFIRYEPDMVTFPFEGGRSIAPEAIAYAKKINERFPLAKKNKESISGGGHLQPRDIRAEKILATGKNNPNISANLAQKCLKEMFDSSRTFGLFTTYFDPEFYHYAANSYVNIAFGRERRIYTIVGITRVLEDVEISRRNHLFYRDIYRFPEQDFCQIHEENTQIPAKLKPYLTARMDIKLLCEGDLQVLSVSDPKAMVSKPAWFQKDGVGYVIHSYIGKLKITAKAFADGQMQLRLRGLNIRNPANKSERIPYWIDYTKLTVNGETIFDTLTPTWHGEFYSHDINVKTGKEINIQVEWFPHRSDT